MMVSFSDYTPLERFDGLPWTQILIHEGASAAGPWVLIQTINLNPVDADPAHPATRDFSTVLGTIPFGWYKISWKDAAGQIIETPPVQNVANIAWRPTLRDVGSIDMARTRNDVGVNIGTFSQKTQPTDDQVQDLIEKSVGDLIPLIGTTVPPTRVQDAQNLAALRAAMYIELSYFGTEIAQNRSPYAYYKELYKEKKADVISAIEAAEAGSDDETNPLSLGTSPAFGFPAAEGLWDKRM